MNSKKDEPGKAAGPAGTSPNRPHATLDLKATEVTPPGTEEKPPRPEAPPGAAPQSESKGGGGAPPKPAAPARAAMQGGFFTHLAAGVIGGILALLAAGLLSSQLGLINRGQGSDTASLRQRIAALEAADRQQPGTGDLSARLTAAESTIGKLANLSAAVDRLGKEQQTLAGEMQSVDSKLAAQGDGANAEARIKNLEDRLAALAAAAERDPESGRLPQLAAVTGKIADLETTMRNQLDALRKSVNDEIETRLMVVNEASEAAKSGTQRLDREVAALKAENAQLVAELNALKAEGDRASTTLKTTADSLASLRAEIEARLATYAKPADVSSAVTPISDKLSSLQSDVQGVIKNEEGRKATAERIVLSLELADLKRTIDRGAPYAGELAHVQRLAGTSIDLAPLERFADKGVPTEPELRQDFKAVAFKIIDAAEEPADGSIVDRLLAGAKSVVRVRRISHGSDDKSVEAVVARMETALAEDRLESVLQEAKALPPPALAAAQDFLAKVEAREAVDRALDTVETQLKSSLVGTGGGADAPQR